MIYDALNTFALADTVVGATGRALIGDQIDLQGLGNSVVGGARDIGNGRPVYVVIVVKTTVDSAAEAATISFEVVSDAAAAIAVDGSATEHVVSPTFTEAQLVSGFAYVVALPLEGPVYERYLGIIANVGGEAVTAGTIDAFLTIDPHGYKHYSQGQVV